MHEAGDAVISVRDTGMGIPSEEQSRLFDRFFRSQRASEQAVPGVGLGLTIVKAIVEGHGGTIDLESTEGRGTTFRVRVPLTPPAEGFASLPATTEVLG
jgi:signal transduction histidine kinase